MATFGFFTLIVGINRSLILRICIDIKVQNNFDCCIYIAIKSVQIYSDLNELNKHYISQLILTMTH